MNSGVVFVLSMDDRGLCIFPSANAAIAECEGIDVEDGNYTFWDENGCPLKAVFSRPNRRGFFGSVLSGKYALVPSADSEPLIDALHKVGYLEPSNVFASIDALREHLRGYCK